jgi:hypothetical protein
MHGCHEKNHRYAEVKYGRIELHTIGGIDMPCLVGLSKADADSLVGAWKEDSTIYPDYALGATIGGSMTVR